MCGYVLLDLWKLVAERLATSRGLGKGSLFLANQTKNLLQAVALNLVVVTKTKEPEGDPWRHGHCRLGEIAVEEFFGHVRSQNTSAQHSARSFWKASAKHMLVREARGGETKPTSDILRSLTAEEFRSASKRAYQAALKLVAVCSGLTEESLKNSYEAHCEAHCGVDKPEPLHPFEDDDVTRPGADGHDDDGNNPEEVNEAIGLMPEEAKIDETELQQGEQMEDEDAADLGFGSLPDPQELRELLMASEPEETQPEKVEREEDPETLHQAVADLPHHPCKASLFDQLFRLTMYLRYWNFGSSGINENE